MKVQYFGTDKKRFQLEIREAASKKAGDGYELQSQRKGFKRYTTDRTKVCFVLLFLTIVFDCCSNHVRCL